MTGADRIIGVCAVLCSTGAEAMGQLAFKSAANRPDAGNESKATDQIGKSFGNALRTTMRNFRWVLGGWLSFAIQASLWSVALYHLDVSIAHPIGGLTFVVVAVASRFVLGERISPRRWAGIGLILAGSALVALN